MLWRDNAAELYAKKALTRIREGKKWGGKRWVLRKEEWEEIRGCVLDNDLDDEEAITYILGFLAEAGYVEPAAAQDYEHAFSAQVRYWG